MRKKIEGNGMWEFNRMMLPEHKTAINNLNDHNNDRQCVYLDDQELELIGRRLMSSLHNRTIIEVRLNDPADIEGVDDGG